MLPGSHRLRRSAEFGTVVRRGAKKGRRTVVAHAHVDSSQVRVGGARFGLIVSKSVGNSVTRHRVSRRLRHLAAGMIDTLGSDLMIVVRANPAAAQATHAELERDFRICVSAAGERAREAMS